MSIYTKRTQHKYEKNKNTTLRQKKLKALFSLDESQKKTKYV